jgi:hypothetical protein
MTSPRQIEANRCNATKSTGPKTEAGKLRSRRNAVRHGLSAETVIEIVEDIEDYRGFEAGVIADYDARTTVERELVLRLASLLWRLRRATAIETDLLRIQAEILTERRYARLQAQHIPSLHSEREGGDVLAPSEPKHSTASSFSFYAGGASVSSPRDVALSFQRLANLDHAVFERLGRYEAALARQVLQCLFFLRSAQCR